MKDANDIRLVKIADGMEVAVAKDVFREIVNHNATQLASKHPKMLFIPINVEEAEEGFQMVFFEVYDPEKRMK